MKTSNLTQKQHTPLAMAIYAVLGTTFTPMAWAGAAAPVISPDVIGPEIPVNTVTLGNQLTPSVAMDADGDFVVSWQGLDADLTGIFAQRYNADGASQGNEFPVNIVTTGNQIAPSVAMDADGDFVVSWQSPDDSANGIFARRYNADGVPQGSEFPVNTVTAGNQVNPSIAMDADGDFVVSWRGIDVVGTYGIYAQRYNADGDPQGIEFLVSTTTVVVQSSPSIAMDAGGDFVVSWHRQDGIDNDIFAQRYNADGVPQGSEFGVNTVTAGDQSNPSIAMDADGDFVVIWAEVGNFSSIFARRFNADGVPQSNRIQVNTLTVGDPSSASIAMDADGFFVVSWSNPDADVNGIFAQNFNADGTRQGIEFQVNTFQGGDQIGSSIAMDADGDFVVSWQGPDANLIGIFAQRYTGAGETVDLNLVVNDDTDPVTVGNNFVYSLITTNNGTGIAMDVNLSEPLPTGLTYVSDDSASAGWVCAPAATTLECNLPFMNPTATNTINVTVTASTAGTISNVVTASAAQIDANPTDNTDTETTEIVEPASSGGGGSMSWFSGLLLLPLAFRRRFNKR